RRHQRADHRRCLTRFVVSLSTVFLSTFFLSTRLPRDRRARPGRRPCAPPHKQPPRHVRRPTALYCERAGPCGRAECLPSPARAALPGSVPAPPPPPLPPTPGHWIRPESSTPAAPADAFWWRRPPTPPALAFQWCPPGRPRGLFPRW